MALPIGGIWRKFIDLLPRTPRYLGDVISVEPGDRYIVRIIGGGLLICTSATPYTIGTRVFLSDKKIEGSAPGLPEQLIEV